MRFIELVNAVSRRVNEVELTESNFVSADGYFASAKDAVNASLRFINQDTFTWPFNWAQETLLLTPGVERYSFPVDAKHLSFDTFRIRRLTEDHHHMLHSINYEDYLRHSHNSSGRPHMVYRRPGLEFGLHETPREAFELTYDYYRLPLDLEGPNDEPSIPDNFKHVVVDGAMYYVYLFRSNDQSAMISYEKFQEGIKDLRSIYINRWENIGDTRVNRRSSGYYTLSTSVYRT